MGWEDPLEKVMATHSSILAWRISWMYSPWGCKELDMTEWLSLKKMHLQQCLLNEWVHGCMDAWMSWPRALFIQCIRYSWNSSNLPHAFLIFFFTSGSFSSISLTHSLLFIFPMFSRAPIIQMLELIDWLPVCLICSLTFHMLFSMIFLQTWFLFFM